MSRVLAIGLDSVEREYVDRLVDDGELPELRRLRDRSATARLEVERPYRSEFAWTQFVSGTTAETLGYWSTLSFDPVGYRCVVAGAAAAAPFYALGAQRRVIALDVPHSRLHHDVEGAQVIGWGAHDPQYPRSSRPVGLLAAIEGEHGEHPGIPIEYTGGWNQPRFLDRFAGLLLEGTRRRVAVVNALMAHVPDWDLFVIGIGDAHTAAHHMWHGVDDRSPLHSAPTAVLAGDRLRAIHRALDRSIGEIVSGTPPDTRVVVFSVKGMGPADVDVVSSALVPELLNRITFGRSLLQSPRSSTGPIVGPVIVPDEAMRPDRFVWQHFADSGRDRFARWARRRWPRAARLARRLARRRRPPRHTAPTVGPVFDDVPIEELEPVPSSLDRWHPECWFRDYWPRMRAFVIPSFSDLHIRINLRGRERAGLVAREDYERACDEIEAILRACTNARTGRPVFSRSTRIRARDPFAAVGPSADLVVECAEPTDVLEHPRAGVIGPFPFPRVGAHTSHGFAWISGPDVAPHDLGAHPAIDLPATVLDMLGIDPAGRCEGQPMLRSRAGAAHARESTVSTVS
jgi:predicted AlkP superfamily phosphohydrolase/phosphomutase